MEKNIEKEIWHKIDKNALKDKLKAIKPEKTIYLKHFLNKSQRGVLNG